MSNEYSENTQPCDEPRMNDADIKDPPRHHGVHDVMLCESTMR